MRVTGFFALTGLLTGLLLASEAYAQPRPAVEVVSQAGHSGRVTAVGFAADGTVTAGSIARPTWRSAGLGLDRR